MLFARSYDNYRLSHGWNFDMSYIMSELVSQTSECSERVSDITQQMSDITHKLSMLHLCHNLFMI